MVASLGVTEGGGPRTVHCSRQLNAERAIVEEALEDARRGKSEAARALGLTRTQLYVRLRRHGPD